jgi:hypothetical protein
MSNPSSPLLHAFTLHSILKLPEIQQTMAEMAREMARVQMISSDLFDVLLFPPPPPSFSLSLTRLDSSRKR